MGRLINYFILILVLVFFSACGEVMQQVPLPKKNLQKDNARVTIHRVSNMGAGSGIMLHLLDDKKYLGFIGEDAKLVWDRKPGKLKLIRKIDYGSYGIKYQNKGEFNLKPNEKYTFYVSSGGTVIRKVGKFFTDEELKSYKKNKIVENHKKTILNYLENNDLKALKKYTEDNPHTIYYIPNKKITLLLMGQKGMKVGNIQKMLKNGRSEKIIISLIKQVDVAYKKFTIDEIDILISMGLSENIITSMIDVSTEIFKDEKRAKERTSYEEQQKKIVNNSKFNKNSSTSNKVQDELVNQGVKYLLKQLF